MPPTFPPRRPNETIEDRLNAHTALFSLHDTPIYQIPAEVLLNVLDRLPVSDYPSLIPAIWHLLRHHEIVPTIPTEKLKLLLVWPRSGFFDSHAHACAGDGNGHPAMPRHMRRA